MCLSSRILKNEIRNHLLRLLIRKRKENIGKLVGLIWKCTGLLWALNRSFTTSPYTNDLTMFGKMENTQSGLWPNLNTENYLHRIVITQKNLCSCFTRNSTTHSLQMHFPKIWHRLYKGLPKICEWLFSSKCLKCITPHDDANQGRNKVGWEKNSQWHLSHSFLLRADTRLPCGSHENILGVMTTKSSLSAFLSCRMISLKPVIGKMPLILP